MFRLLLLTFSFSFSAALAAPTPVRKAEPFMVHLILKTADGRALQHGYKAGVDLQTGPITTLTVKDWNGVELVAGDVISLSSHDETVQAARLAGSQKLAWQLTQTKPETRFVLRKVEGAEGSPIVSGDRVRLQLFGDKDSYLSSNAELVQVTTPGPEQTWLVRRGTYGNQAARKLYWDAGSASTEPGGPAKSKAMYEAAFQLGALDAAGAIGDMYLDGKFGSKDLQQAAAYYRKGAEAGEPSAMYLYGVMLYRGAGVSENKTEAVRWEQMASRADYTNATTKLKEWGEPVPGVAVAAVAKPPTPAVWQPKWQAGTFFDSSNGQPYAVITKVDQANKRYLLLTRTWYEKQEPYYLTAQEFGHYILTESWVTDDFKGVAMTAKYRACDQCGGEACQYVEGGRARGGQWESVGYNVQVYTPRRVPLSYTKVVCCGGCGGAGWIKR